MSIASKTSPDTACQRAHARGRSAPIAALALLFTLAPSPARAEGVAWTTDLDAALSAAASSGRRVLIAFEADWCSSCRRLRREVLDTPEGAAFARTMIPVHLDFDAPDNRRHVERYVILGLPTVVVLDKDGTQVGRVMGYDGKAAWLEAARAARGAADPLPALRKAVKARPDDVRATLALGRALLVRGRAERGERLLESLLWIDDKGDKQAKEAAAQALFVLGRYYHRVRRLPATARYIWRALAQRHPGSSWASGAWWWYARAEAEMGRHAIGLKALRARAHHSPDNVAALEQWGRYLVKYRLLASRDEAVAFIAGAAAKLGEKDRAEIKPVLDALKAL